MMMMMMMMMIMMINPFTGPTCKISELKDAGTCLQSISVSGPITSTANAVHFDENPFARQCENEI